MPHAHIFVYDNASTDNTSQEAQKAGAIVRHESNPGKGNVVRRMFGDIEADVYVLVDGDDTYDASAAPKLVSELVYTHKDMVNGSRVDDEVEAYRLGHRFGNRILTGLVTSIFGHRFSDMLTGYRVFSRHFVKSFPALASEFEIETELTVHALELRMPVIEIETRYKSRPEGSESKLRTYSDGLRILRTIATLVKEERPMAFFGGVSLLLALASIGFAIPVITEYMATGLVPRLPTALLSTRLMLSALLSLFCRLILDTVTHGRREAKRMAYLAADQISHRRQQPHA